MVFLALIRYTTLIINGLEFRGQELSKRPDMIGRPAAMPGVCRCHLGWISPKARGSDEAEARANL